MSKKQALTQIVTLAEEHNITADEINAALVQTSIQDKSGSWLSTFMAYIGGAFIVGGLALLTGMIWDDLGSLSRVIITYGPGIVAFILGIITVKDQKFEKASTPLFLLSAHLMPSGMFIFLHEFAQGDNVQLASLLVFGVVAIQFLSTFYSLRRTSLLFFGYLFAITAFGVLMDMAYVPYELIGVGLGLSILTFAYTVDKTPHRAIAAFYYFIGGLGFLWACFDILEDANPIDILFLPLTIFMMLLSVKVKSRTLLLVSTFALLGYLGYFTDQYFADILGWPIALIILGFILIGISTKAIKLGQSIKNSR